MRCGPASGTRSPTTWPPRADSSRLGVGHRVQQLLPQLCHSGIRAVQCAWSRAPSRMKVRFTTGASGPATPEASPSSTRATAPASRSPTVSLSRWATVGAESSDAGTTTVPSPYIEKSGTRPPAWGGGMPGSVCIRSTRSLRPCGQSVSRAVGSSALATATGQDKEGADQARGAAGTGSQHSGPPREPVHLGRTTTGGRSVNDPGAGSVLVDGPGPGLAGSAQLAGR